MKKQVLEIRKYLVILCVLMVASLCAATAFARRVDVLAETTGAVHLYDVETTESFNDYFSKQDNVTLGTSHYFNNPTKFKKYIVTAVKNNGTKHISTLTYDISAYDFDYFKVTVGSNNMEGQAPWYTNEVRYSVLIDGVEKAATSRGLKAGEFSFLECQVPSGAKTLVLMGESIKNEPYYGDANWADPTLTNFVTESKKLIELPVSQNSTEIETGEGYQTGTFTIGGVSYPDSVFGLTHGNYGTEQNPIFKFSAIYDVSGTVYNKISVTVGVEANPEVEANPDLANEIVFSLMANDKEIAKSNPLINGQSQTISAYLPAGAQELLLWAQSNDNKKAYGAVVWGTPTLSFEKSTPVLDGEITAVGGTVKFGTSTPEIQGTFKVGETVVAGTLTLDAGQKLVLGTAEYDYTFRPDAASLYNEVRGKVSLNVEQAETLRLSEMQYTGIASWLPTPDSNPYFVKGSQLLGTTDLGNERTFNDALLLVLHGPYQEEDLPGSYFSSITYDITGMTYDSFSVIVGNRNMDPTNNNEIKFSVIVDGEIVASTPRGLVFGEIGRLTARIPAGAKELRLHAYSTVDMQACGDTVWADATLSNFTAPSEKSTPSPYSEVTTDGINLRFGDELPNIFGTFAADKIIVGGTVSFDEGQTLKVGTHSYNYTFTPDNTDEYNIYRGSVSLTVGKGIIKGITFEDKTVVYDGTEHEIVIGGTLPVGVTVKYTMNKGTRAGTYAATAEFVIDEAYADSYEILPNLEATLTITEKSYISQNNAAKTYKKGDNADVEYTLSDTPVNIVVKNGTETVSAENYTLSGTSLKFKAGYLESLSEGEYTFRVESDGGNFALSLKVEKAASKGGCSNSCASASVLTVLNLLALYVVFRRK